MRKALFKKQSNTPVSFRIDNEERECINLLLRKKYNISELCRRAIRDEAELVRKGSRGKKDV